MKKIFAALTSTALLAAALTGCAAEQATGAADEKRVAAVSITDGWVRVYEGTREVGGMTGGFATMTNNTDQEITLVGASSELATMTEVHEVVMIDGEMKMQAKDGGITIAPGETVTLEPGGLHVMLMGLKNALLEGEEVQITLDFEGADDVEVVWPAKASAAGNEEYTGSAE